MQFKTNISSHLIEILFYWSDDITVLQYILVFLRQWSSRNDKNFRRKVNEKLYGYEVPNATHYLCLMRKENKTVKWKGQIFIPEFTNQS